MVKLRVKNKRCRSGPKKYKNEFISPLFLFRGKCILKYTSIHEIILIDQIHEQLRVIKYISII